MEWNLRKVSTAGLPQQIFWLSPTDCFELQGSLGHSNKLERIDKENTPARQTDITVTSVHYFLVVITISGIAWPS